MEEEDAAEEMECEEATDDYLDRIDANEIYEVIDVDLYIAIRAPSNSVELFYLIIGNFRDRKLTRILIIRVNFISR